MPAASPFSYAVYRLLPRVRAGAGVVLARTDARAGGVAARSALGASRVRLVRLLLVEGIALGLLGGACGALLTVAGVAVCGFNLGVYVWIFARRKSQD